MLNALYHIDNTAMCHKNYIAVNLQCQSKCTPF